MALLNELMSEEGTHQTKASEVTVSLTPITKAEMKRKNKDDELLEKVEDFETVELMRATALRTDNDHDNIFATSS